MLNISRKHSQHHGCGQIIFYVVVISIKKKRMFLTFIRGFRLFISQSDGLLHLGPTPSSNVSLIVFGKGENIPIEWIRVGGYGLGF